MIIARTKFSNNNNNNNNNNNDKYRHNYDLSQWHDYSDWKEEEKTLTVDS